jgi:hypothetical protein
MLLLDERKCHKPKARTCGVTADTLRVETKATPNSSPSELSLITKAVPPRVGVEASLVLLLSPQKDYVS